MAYLNVHEVEIKSPSTGRTLNSHSGLLLPGDPEFSHTMQKGSIMIGGEEVAMTIQCCHCGGHWIPIRFSKRVRGFCRHCMAPHCGNPSCWACVPAEKKLEKIESDYKYMLRHQD